MSGGGGKEPLLNSFHGLDEMGELSSNKVDVVRDVGNEGCLHGIAFPMLEEALSIPKVHVILHVALVAIH